MIPIVFSTDHNYIMPTGVTISSLFFNRKDEHYNIYLLISSDVTNEDKIKLLKQVRILDAYSSISFIEMGDSFKDGFEIRGISRACYYRLMIPWLLPELDKVIYCDVDIIFKSNLKELYDLKLENYYVAGALPNSKDGWKWLNKYFKKIGIDYKKYINSGVLVINCKLQRECNLYLQYQNLTKKNFIYQDQDIINIVCKNKILFFSNRYNLMPSLVGSNRDLNTDLIIHYAGDKPWKSFTYSWEEWWIVCKKTIFYDYVCYNTLCNKINNPIFQFKHFCDKVKIKVRQKISNYL